MSKHFSFPARLLLASAGGVAEQFHFVDEMSSLSYGMSSRLYELGGGIEQSAIWVAC